MAARNDLPVKPGQGRLLVPPALVCCPPGHPASLPLLTAESCAFAFQSWRTGPALGPRPSCPLLSRGSALQPWGIGTSPRSAVLPVTHARPAHRNAGTCSSNPTPPSTPQALQLALPQTPHSSVHSSPSMGPTCLPRAPYGHCVTEAPSALGSLPCLSCPPAQKGERNCKYVGC